MSPAAARASDRRRWCIGVLTALFLLAPSGAEGQRLLRINPLDPGPFASPPRDGVQAVIVNQDLVRSAPSRLELPTLDGRLLVAELSVFEDRGEGNVMWAGRFPGAGYESVVLTVQDGYLRARVGEPGGARFRVVADPTGRGRMARSAGRSAGFCAGGALPNGQSLLLPAVAGFAEPPRRVPNSSSHDRLDVLVVYTPAAQERWSLGGEGPPTTVIQSYMDYFNLLFRNSEMPVTAGLVHLAEAPARLSGGGDVIDRLRTDPVVAQLREQHSADLVHLIAGEPSTEYLGRVCGRGYLLRRGDTAVSFSPFGYAYTSVGRGCQSADEILAHEIGHNLGANHDPPNAGGEAIRQSAVQPYAFGHTWFSPSAPNPPDIDTIMSYGSGRVEPFFSTVRIRPNGWTLGIAGQRENERALYETVHLAVQYSDSLRNDPEPPPPPPPGERPAPPRSLKVSATSPARVRFTWIDNSHNERGFRVQRRLQGQRWQTAKTVAPNSEAAEIDGLVRGGRYDFRVQAFNDNGSSNSNVVTVVLEALEYTDCVPTAPQITFGHGYTVSMCIEYLDKGVGPIVRADAQDYGLDSRESGVLYFFDRDNSEVLIKVLDACAVNGYRWVFVAPVTTLAFNLYVDEMATGKRWMHRNPKGDLTATAKSDLEAFPCDAAGSSAAAAGGGDGIHGVDLVDAGFRATPVLPLSSTPAGSPLQPPAAVAQAISGGEGTDCEPQPVLSLSGGYTVNMCVEYLKDGEAVVVGAKDYELDSEQSAILYFFDRNNAEVLIKVLDGCALNGHRWVFVAPVTSLAFNLTVESPDGEVWTRDNRLNQTAEARSDIMAFACSE